MNASGGKLVRQTTVEEDGLGMSFGIAISKKRLLKAATDNLDSPDQLENPHENNLANIDTFSNTSIHYDETRATS
jgi:hypothetical protein